MAGKSVVLNFKKVRLLLFSTNALEGFCAVFLDIKLSLLLFLNCNVKVFNFACGRQKYDGFFCK